MLCPDGGTAHTRARQPVIYAPGSKGDEVLTVSSIGKPSALLSVEEPYIVEDPRSQLGFEQSQGVSVRYWCSSS